MVVLHHDIGGKERAVIYMLLGQLLDKNIAVLEQLMRHLGILVASWYKMKI